MKQSPIRNLSLIAVLYFTANINAQQSKKDTAANEKKIEEVVVIGYGTQKKVMLPGLLPVLRLKNLKMFQPEDQNRFCKVELQGFL